MKRSLLPRSLTVLLLAAALALPAAATVMACEEPAARPFCPLMAAGHCHESPGMVGQSATRSAPDCCTAEAPAAPAPAAATPAPPETPVPVVASVAAPAAAPRPADLVGAEIPPPDRQLHLYTLFRSLLI